MDRNQRLRAALFAAFLLFLAPSQIQAYPYPKDDLHDAGYSYLMPRACEQYCGADNQYCCGAGSACFTENGIAKCAAGQNVLTTTWTETNTFTSTITTKWVEAAPTPIDKSVPCVPQSPGWSSCGWICCDWWQQCGEIGQCVPKPGFEDGPPAGSGTTTIVMTTDGQLTTLTTQFSAPFRVTGTGSPESTGLGGAGGAGQDDDGSAGLSGGAIAGIVVGTLAGICLLSFICFCCIAKGILGAIFGRKKKEDHYDDKYTRRSSRHSSQHTKRQSHGSWFGSSVSTRHEPKKKSGGAKWLGLAGLAATMLALLNFRKSKKRPESRTPTMYTDSYMQFKLRRRIETCQPLLAPLGRTLTPLSLHPTYAANRGEE
ncbi:uncharacterized protein DNG_06915 [Cephalotrichum gorgonifer]|uniref:Uncharacterized protein n=1 Tax=Cephalotrichum gorgonifer TaxID=2041049 RepID=A0AAE8SXR9_9PEZI|nr:uncharacterized protein DNG_06915 [Cephalotrichum gorgonifer]